MKILLVDDQEQMRSLIEKILARDEFQCKSAANVEEARRCLEGEHFDLIISDYQMPGGTGFDLLQQVKETYPDIPFIMYSGCGDESIAYKACEMGACEYIEKPFTCKKLLTIVSQHMDGR